MNVEYQYKAQYFPLKCGAVKLAAESFLLQRIIMN